MLLEPDAGVYAEHYRMRNEKPEDFKNLETLKP